MRKKRNQKRRLFVQSLETRHLFAADVGVSPSCSAEVECKVPALTGSIQPSETECKVQSGIECKVPLGANGGGSVNPGGDVEVNGEPTETEKHPAPTKTPPIVHGPHVITADGALGVGQDVGNGDASTAHSEPKPTEIDRPVFGPHIITFFSGMGDKIM
ncbi:MAG: hypothetical protein ACR2N1_12210 [Rubripirellula sp.]